MDKIKVLTRRPWHSKETQERLLNGDVNIAIHHNSKNEQYLYVLSSSEIIENLRQLEVMAEILPVNNDVSCFYAGTNEESVINALREIGDVEIVQEN